ncbi:hypothetical protein [Phyllobacterium sp. YR531]|uniref:hypothetical protein n=1 Tax=Phyllobacterium sp. YR531 TaxID=1144343 RepID=UPI00026FC376|nr:hypothetical protein [Phyllobacterium sp. YR531]EJN04296.1 hypothetical protein PMI41_01936 [Phyllobacterium sp. YR531]
MPRDISNDIVVGLKDRLRDVRHLIRASRQDAALTPRELPEFMLDKVARVMDKAFTTVEALSISVISQNPAAHSSAPEARSLAVYFSEDHEAGATLFCRDIYYLTKYLLKTLHEPNALIHEASFASVHSIMIRRHAILLAAARNGDQKNIGKACAALTMELQTHYCSTSLFGAQTSDQGKTLLCFAALALAIGLATYSEHPPSGEKLVETTLLALQARPDKFEQAITRGDNLHALSDLFAFLIPHLP